MIDTEKINNTIQNFENTIDALKSIEAINTDIGDQLVVMHLAVDKLDNSSKKIVEEVNSFTTSLKSIECCIEETNKSNNDNTSKITNELQSMVSKVTNDLKNQTQVVDQLKETITKYTLSTQGSVDELRISQNNNSSEIRLSISEVKESIKKDIINISQAVDKVSKDVDKISIKQKTDHTLILIGVISATVASVVSIISLFI